MRGTDILTLLGGLALFLYGMQMMSNGLETAAGNKMKAILEKLTSNGIKGVLVGAGITAVIQSSSATTVMVVGFVNSGLMSLNQAVWVIMGANIGTTITGQLIALDIGAVAPLIAFAGVACILFVKNKRICHISEIFAGLGVLFIGMDMMGKAMEPLQDSEAFIHFMTTFSNPLLGILIGAIFTAVIQSSSASVGILQALAGTGMIPLSSAVYILFGQNIGTCITAVLASIGTKTNAKRTTIIHLMFNMIGTAVFTFICIATPFVSWMEATAPGNQIQQIANIHTTFNIVTTLLLLPFGGLMARAAVRMLPDKKEEADEIRHLRYLSPFEPSYPVGHAAAALSEIEREVDRMLSMARNNTAASFDAALEGGHGTLEKIEAAEEYINYLNTEISRYIGRLMTVEMSVQDSKCINAYYVIISNIERIGDHAVNIAGYAEDMRKWGLSFSEHALDDIRKMKQTSLETLDILGFSTGSSGREMLERTAQNEQKIDDMRQSYLKKQIKRMQSGDCRAEAGLLFSEMLTDFERIGDHALNIAELYSEMSI
ncbi:Na/Pi cotransporter family protein [Dorea sp. D27]|uniref:Na/Pi cotransporter family protein n=1 Tax=Dorea sp. D27 TaxID=658665 RepID=UPI000673AF48|nr:Na/Pi cotransporter family protein [Dorea sp. D27]KMZ55134.1 Na/Pi-cotransporter family protein [Dorea sp. D27]